MAGVKVTLDREECISCGACWADCPEFFEEGDDGLSQVVERYQVGGNPAEGLAPEDLADCVRSAAEGCPVEVIHVEG
ncbi:MAG: ferredoxin [Anaerolineae bacterium]